MIDMATDLVTRPLVAAPTVAGLLVVNLSPLLDRIEQVARAGTQVCAFGIGVCMLVLYVRKVRRGARGDEKI